MADGRDAPDIHWVDPRRRGIFPIGGLHVSRSLARRLRRGDYEARINTDFEQVLDACADRNETWINPTIRTLCLELHQAGFAHSQEIWRAGRLIGGVYGVTLGAAFFGESMFSRQTDGSKLALAHLDERLRVGGYTLFDTQFLTPHLASLGAMEISRAEYHRRLGAALNRTAEFQALDNGAV